MYTFCINPQNLFISRAPKRSPLPWNPLISSAQLGRSSVPGLESCRRRVSFVSLVSSQDRSLGSHAGQKNWDNGAPLISKQVRFKHDQFRPPSGTNGSVRFTNERIFLRFFFRWFPSCNSVSQIHEHWIFTLAKKQKNKKQKKSRKILC